MNKESYRYEMIQTDKGMFDNYIDMAYILTMEDSNRKDSYMNQINTYKPHKNILIQYNKGYKKSVKKLLKQDSINDLNDAYYHAFLNAYNNNYNNIIIFEDDFFFDNMINQAIVDNIGKFINENEYHFYHLGSTINLSLPTLGDHLRVYFILTSHGVIYSRKYMEYYINKYEKNKIILNLDLDWNDINIIKYIYYKPLCFQKFPQTENRSAWPLSSIIVPLLELLKLDKMHQPGYNILNILSKIISHMIFCFIIIILVLITNNIIHRIL